MVGLSFYVSLVVKTSGLPNPDKIVDGGQHLDTYETTATIFALAMYSVISIVRFSADGGILGMLAALVRFH